MRAALALALRTWRRHPLALAVLGAVGCGLIVAFAISVRPPRDAKAAGRLLATTWLIAGTAWCWALALVAAVAPAVRAVAAGERVSQHRVLGRGIVNAWRMALPIAIAFAAIAIGTLALVVPGLALIVLLALTGASTERGLPGPLVDSVAAVRVHLRAVVVVVAATAGIALLLAGGAHLVLIDGPLPKQPAPAQLAAFRDLARVVALGCAIVAPLAATVLAAIHARRADA